MSLEKPLREDLKRAIVALHVFTVTRLNKTMASLRRVRGPVRYTPLRPEDARDMHLFDAVPTVVSCDYALAPRAGGGHHPVIDVPDGWTPDPAAPLDAALPYPWDAEYLDRQPFQPVKLWRNAIALNRYIATAPGPAQAEKARALAAQLVARMRDYTVWQDGAAFVENRFTDPHQSIVPPTPWVSAIANAFALMACRQLNHLLDLEDDIEGYGKAFLRPHQMGATPPDRWITVRDKRGYLWFDEYPLPRGKTTRVKNGHIFAVLALHELSLHDPRYRPLVQAGATTIDAYALCFRRKKLRSRYCLRYWRKPDYLAHRAMRQLYQLYELTGDAAFLDYGDQFLADFSVGMTDELKAVVAASRETATTRRKAHETVAAGRTSTRAAR